MLSPGAEVQGRYRIERLLGEGGQGRVYLANHLELQEKVALKEMVVPPGEDLEAAVRQFRAEARILHQIQHPGLPRVHDLVDDGGLHYLVMDYISGQTLMQWAREYGTPMEAQVLKWTMEILDILHYLHSHNPPIVVRDLKPSNIMLGDDGQLRLIDFGIAKGGGASSEMKTTTAAHACTPGFAAPEQYSGGTDARTDLYALGATMYYLLSGTIPPISVELLVGTACLAPLRMRCPHVSSTVERVVHWMLRLDPGSRPQSALQVKAALREPVTTLEEPRPLPLKAEAVTVEMRLSDISPAETAPHVRQPEPMLQPTPPTIRMPRRSWTWLPAAIGGVLLVAGLVLGPGRAADVELSARPSVNVWHGPLRPLPNADELQLDARDVALGEKLFASPALSADGKLSCMSCHDLKKGGADGLVVGVGHNLQRTRYNVPSVFNAGFNFRNSWDGRAETLEAVVDIALQATMGTTADDAARRVANLPEVRRRFPSGMNGTAMISVLSTYVRSLVTSNSPFDRFLRGEVEALTPDQKEGYRLFTSYGCVSCHQGRNVGGNMFQRIGVMSEYRKGDNDLGRFNVTGREEDRYVFRVPSLRNVARTAPYFHDGSVGSLEGAVQLMARYQLGRQLTGEEVRLLVEFLKSLTGEYRGAPL